MNSGTQQNSIDVEWRRRFARRLFHDLSQPLTALQCSIDLALRKKRSIEDYEKVLSSALEQASKAIRIAELSRQIAEADDCGERTAVDLSALMVEVIELYAPVAEAKGVVLENSVAATAVVKANPETLRRSIFQLLDTALHRTRSGSVLYIELTAGNEISLRVGAERDIAPEGMVDLGEDEGAYTVCAHSMRALGGTMRKKPSGRSESVVITLPANLGG